MGVFLQAAAGCIIGDQKTAFRARVVGQRHAKTVPNASAVAAWETSEAALNSGRRIHSQELIITGVKTIF